MTSNRRMHEGLYKYPCRVNLEGIWTSLARGEFRKYLELVCETKIQTISIPQFKTVEEFLAANPKKALVENTRAEVHKHNAAKYKFIHVRGKR